jgi:hypothetical protein
MKKPIRYCANEDRYTPPSRPHWIVREMLGFLLGVAIVLPMLLLVAIGWRA